MPNTGNVIGGHKANLNNPNTSEESKLHSKEILERELGGGEGGSESYTEGDSESYTEGDSESCTEGKNPGNVAGGLKATISNPKTSSEAKQSAKERLEEDKY
ncbi:hypothetical protein RUND412_003875 [Rhizina undulata]